MSPTDAEIQALHVEPDDTVLVRYRHNPRSAGAEHIARQVKRFFPDNRVMVVDDAITVDAVRDLRLVKVSGALVEAMGDDWSPPVQCRLVEGQNGIYDMETRTVEALANA